jgi:hypothetical protein
MTPDERVAFIAKLQETSALFGHRMRDDVADAYARAVEGVPVALLLLALDHLARATEPATRFPMPRELVQQARGAWHRPARNLTDAEADAVRQHVWRTMAEWERAHPTGSARPAFERAWKAALRAEGIRPSPQLAEAREAIWQTWLKAGTPLTRERIVELLADVTPRAAPTLARGLRDLVTAIERAESPTAPGDAVGGALAATVARVLDATNEPAPAPSASAATTPASEPPAPPAEHPMSRSEPEPPDDGPTFTEF